MHLGSLSSVLLSAVAVAALAGSALADSSQAVRAGEATVRLLASGSNNTKSAPVFRGGIEIALNPGWKTYWRYPGDAGIPPRFDWSGSENVADIKEFFPAPKKIMDGSGQASIGYEERVIFPLRIEAKDPGKPVTLKLKMNFATCEKLCIPAEASLSLTFSAAAVDEPLLREAEKRVPKVQDASSDGAVSIVSAKIERGKAADGKDDRIIIKARADGVTKPQLFAEGPGEEWTLSLPSLIGNEAGLATFAIPLQGARLGSNAAPPKLRLTLVAGEQAIERFIVLD